MRIAEQLMGAIAAPGDIVSRLRESQFRNIIEIAMRGGKIHSIVDVLEVIRKADRINEGEYELDGERVSGKQLIRVLSNMLAVYIGKTFMFMKGNRRNPKLMERYNRVCQILPKLVEADRRWSLVSPRHKAFIGEYLPARFQDLSTWTSNSIGPKRGAVSRNPPTTRRYQARRV